MLGVHAAPVLEIGLNEASVDQISPGNHSDGVAGVIDNHQGADILRVHRLRHFINGRVRPAGDDAPMHPISYG